MKFMKNGQRQSPPDLLTPFPPVTRERIDRTVNEILASLPNPEELSSGQRRGIIARYATVLEGNFIYWMTAAYLSVRSHEAHKVIEANLREEVSDNHPGMLHKFAVAAQAVPTDSDVLAVHRNLTRVRMFVAGLSPLQIVLMMAFFEAFITRFMPYLAELATRQGSDEHEYTAVHGVVDTAHTKELFRAFDAENNTFLEGVLIVTPKKLFVGSNCNFARRVFITAGGGVRIGDWVGIGPDVKIWSVNHKFSDPDSPWASQGWDYKEVIIEDDVWIGANSFIMPGTRIGKGAIISACTVVSKSVPPYAVMAGNPGRVIGWRKKVENPEAAG